MPNNRTTHFGASGGARPKAAPSRRCRQLDLGPRIAGQVMPLARQLHALAARLLTTITGDVGARADARPIVTRQRLAELEAILDARLRSEQANRSRRRGNPDQGARP
jgi:hypothetical protein